MSAAAFELALIWLRSVMPDDGGCEDLVAWRLDPPQSIYRQVLQRLLLPV